MFTKQIDMRVPFQQVIGPFGIRLDLDAKCISPESPGDDTPRLVWDKGESMTLDCALDNVGEIIPEAQTSEAASWAYRWLESLSEMADNWLDYWTDEVASGAYRTGYNK